MSSSPIEVRVDTSGLRQAKAALQTVARATQADLPAGVKAAAAPMFDAVKSAAGFSRRIPASLSIRPARRSMRGAAVQIVADASIAPHAGPINNRGQGGRFEHPVFGHDVQASQQAHPFFHRQAISRAGAAEHVMGTRVMDDAARKAGFR